MDLSNRYRSSERPQPRPSSQARPTTPQPTVAVKTETSSNDRPPAPKVPKSKRRWLILVASIVAAATLIGLAGWWWQSGRALAVQGDRYQVVVMDDGQVFFGKLRTVSGDFLTLDDAYYTPQAIDSKNKDEAANTSNQPLSIIEVGEEVYGPERSLALDKSSVRYWQNLRADSKFVEAIKQR